MKLSKSIFLILFLFQASSLFSQTQNFLEKPYLETTATYTTEVTPDRIFLNIQIAEKDTKGKISIEQLESKMITALNSIGIETEKQLSVSDLSSDFKKYLLKKKDVLKSKHYVLIVYDAKSLAQVANKLEQINISNITIQKTEYSKLEELKIELRAKAILKAKKQAESMLKPLNQNLGKAIFISDTDSPVNRLLRGKASGLNTVYRSDNAGLGFANIDIANVRVQVSVIVYFEIL
jgi:uncharacterized protein YggE